MLLQKLCSDHEEGVQGSNLAGDGLELGRRIFAQIVDPPCEPWDSNEIADAKAETHCRSLTYDLRNCCTDDRWKYDKPRFSSIKSEVSETLGSQKGGLGMFQVNLRRFASSQKRKNVSLDRDGNRN